MSPFPRLKMRTCPQATERGRFSATTPMWLECTHRHGTFETAIQSLLTRCGLVYLERRDIVADLENMPQKTPMLMPSYTPIDPMSILSVHIPAFDPNHDRLPQCILEKQGESNAVSKKNLSHGPATIHTSNHGGLLLAGSNLLRRLLSWISYPPTGPQFLMLSPGCNGTAHPPYRLGYNKVQGKFLRFQGWSRNVV